MDQTEAQPHILIAEHGSLMFGELKKVIVQNGFRVAGPFGSTAELAGWIERWTPAVAILGTALRDGSTDELAEVLRRRGVLVLVHDEVVGTSTRSSRHVDRRGPAHRRRRHGA